MIRTIAIWIAFAAVATAAVAQTGTPGAGVDNSRINNPSKRWRSADECNREAFKKYPDYTQEGAAKRDAFVRQCLRDHRLPPQGDSGQSKPPG